MTVRIKHKPSWTSVSQLIRSRYADAALFTLLPKAWTRRSLWENYLSTPLKFSEPQEVPTRSAKTLQSAPLSGGETARIRSLSSPTSTVVNWVSIDSILLWVNRHEWNGLLTTCEVFFLLHLCSYTWFYRTKLMFSIMSLNLATGAIFLKDIKHLLKDTWIEYIIFFTMWVWLETWNLQANVLLIINS